MSYQPANYYESVQLASNFYCYIWQGRGNNCNTCLFVNVLQGERPHVIIDPGHITNDFREPCFEHLIKALEGDCFKIDDVGLILNTHSHSDHCEANEMMMDDGQTLIALSGEEEEFRNTLGERLCSMLGIRAPQFNPFFYLKEGDLALGTGDKVVLQVLHTPGHSPGSVCFYWADKKILISGDVVFYGSVGRTDFPSGSLSSLKSSIDRLSQLDVEYIVPGHSTEFGSIVRGKADVQRNFQTVRMFF